MTKNCMRWILPIAIIVVTGAKSQAESRKPTLSLNAIVQTVADKNPELQYYNAEISKADGAVLNAQKLQNPEFAIDFGRKESSASGIHQGQGLIWEVSYAQTFEYPGRIELREAIAQKHVTIAELQLNKFRLALSNKATNIALELFQAQQNQETTQDIAYKVYNIFKVISQRESAGPAIILEKSLIEGSAISFRQRAIEFAGETEKLSIELNSLSGTDISSRYQVHVTHFGKIPIIPSERSLEAMAFESNPDLRIKKAELAQQGLKVQLALHETNPSLTVRPYYSEERADELEKTIGISLAVPLPIYNDNSGNIAIERAQTSQAETSLRTLEREIKGKITSLYASYRLRSEQIATLGSKSVNSLRNAAQEAEKQYELGVIPAATYLQLQEQYLNNLILYRTSHTQLLKNVAELEQIVAEPLTMERKE
ncbi:MAG: TolC family protein [bacterium]|nr:TolC family protein [bacterium]